VVVILSATGFYWVLLLCVLWKLYFTQLGTFFQTSTSVFPTELSIYTLQCFIQNEFPAKKSETVEIMFALLWLLKYSGPLNNMGVRGADPPHS